MISNIAKQKHMEIAGEEKRRSKVVKVGDMVHVSKFNKKAIVLKVDPSKEEIVVQVGNMKLKLTLADVVT